MLDTRNRISVVGLAAAFVMLNSPLTLPAMASALDQMALAFVGGYAKVVIKRQMNRVLGMYDVPITEENYSRIGSVLVVMRKDTGVPEMKILKCMEEANAGAQVELPKIAAICATLLSR